MNYARIASASLGGMVAYFVYGFAMFAAWPSMKTEFMKYPNVYRPKDEMMKVMPYGMIAIFVAIVVVAILYAKIYSRGWRHRIRHIPRHTHRTFLCLHLRDPQLHQPEHRPYADNLPVHRLLHSVGHRGRSHRRHLQAIVDLVGETELSRGKLLGCCQRLVCKQKPPVLSWRNIAISPIDPWSMSAIACDC